MQKIFVSNEGFERSIPRTRANGYKELVIADDVDVFSAVSVVSEEDKLVVKNVEQTEEDESYTILCDEFGLTGLSEGAFARVSIIFCDNGKMLVTLHEGCLILNLNGKLLMPSVGVDKTPAVYESEIYWIKAETLLGYSKYLRKGKFMYEYELMFVLKGSMVNKMHSFDLHTEPDMDIDISHGWIAKYEQEEQLKAEAKEAKAAFNSFMSSVDDEYEFDDEDDDSDDDDDDDEWGDYGM